MPGCAEYGLCDVFFICLNKLVWLSLNRGGPPWFKHNENLATVVVLVQGYRSRMIQEPVFICV